VLLPLSLVQRYRMGTSRQQARGWLITINLVGITLSCVMFLAGAAVTSIWIPQAFAYSVIGLLGGCILGLLGVALTRWEATPLALHYTPNRLLVLAITLTITGRLMYGFWRAWQTWGGAVERREWLVTWGAAEALAAGAVVLGYYLAYWTGVRRHQKKHERRALRPF
jgi:hypothetical protein